MRLRFFNIPRVPCTAGLPPAHQGGGSSRSCPGYVFLAWPPLGSLKNKSLVGGSCMPWVGLGDCLLLRRQAACCGCGMSIQHLNVSCGLQWCCGRGMSIQHLMLVVDWDRYRLVPEVLLKSCDVHGRPQSSRQHPKFSLCET